MESNEIELKGKCIESFEEKESITDIVLLGKYGGVRRISLKDKPSTFIYTTTDDDDDFEDTDDEGDEGEW